VQDSPLLKSGSVQHGPGSWESVISPGAKRALWESFVTFSLAGLAGNTRQSWLITRWVHTSCFDNLDEPGGDFANFSLCWLVDVDGRTRWESDRSAASATWRARHAARRRGPLGQSE
jgi:hypothetical protein